MESAGGSSSGSNTATSRKSAENTPLWKYVTKLEKLVEKSGNTRFQCNFCSKQYVGTYYRVKGHLLKIKNCGIQPCTQVTKEMISQFQKEIDEVNFRNMPVQVPLPSTTEGAEHQVQDFSMPIGTSQNPNAPSSTKRKKSAIENMFNMEARSKLDHEIARAFYSGGLPFHFARNLHFRNAISFSANNSLSGYTPPTYNALRTTLLQMEKANIEKLLQPIRDDWKEKGVSIVADGWSDSQRRPLINFMAVSEGGPMFLKAVNCEGSFKDKFFIANLMKDVIGQLGPQNVVQIITDNAPVCKSAGHLIEAQYPHIFWTPCVVHTLNLALKNICSTKNVESNEIVYGECHWITEVAERALQIKIFITNHSMRLAMYNQHAHLKLLSIAETRFASAIIMLKRFKVMKNALQSMVISDQWSSYREDDVIKAQAVKATILDDLWWDKLDYILEFTSPIYEMLRFADTDKPSLHLIYDMWDSMIEKVRTIIYRHEKLEPTQESLFYEVVHDILVDRWNKSTSPLHCLAASLNSRYYSQAWLNEAPNRVPPHRDAELSEERNKCLLRYFPNSEARSTVNVEFARFSGAMDVFAGPSSLQDRGTMEAKIWWIIHGASAPNIQGITLKLLNQPCSSSCCERNWSTYSFIHSIRRNKILPQWAEDLVFVHNNLRFLLRKTQPYVEGETNLWDVGGDEFDPLDGAEELEIANLSLDEPDIEAILFQDVDA